MKKNVSKIVAVCLTALLMLSLVACGGKDYAGTYNFVSMNMGGQEITAEMMTAIMPDSKIQLVLKDDGSFTMDAVMDPSAEADSEEGTWEEKDGNLILTVDGQSVTATVKDGTITMSEDGVSMSFKKA